MGYTHYWRREKNLNPEKFAQAVNDFQKVVAELKAFGLELAGGHGKGEAVVILDEVWFNGVSACGHMRQDLGITWPADRPDGTTGEAGEWFAGALLSKRLCNGDCSHESVFIPLDLVPDAHETPENGKYFFFCKTAYKPYDLAVICCLIIFKNYLSHQIQVSSDGTDLQWLDGKKLCQNLLGYGFNFNFNLDGNLEPVLINKK